LVIKRSASEPTDCVVLLLKRAGKLLLECRALAQQLEQEPEGESVAAAAERHTYGFLVAALEEGLVTTLQHAIWVMEQYTGALGPLGAERWLRGQERRHFS